MLTYKKTIDVPRLVISYDAFADNPRKENDNLGYFYTSENKYKSPDGNVSEIYSIMLDTTDNATNTDEHMAMMKQRINDETGEKVLAIYPVNRYEHGNVRYTIGKKNGFDDSACGFYIVTDKTAKIIGAEKKDFESIIKSELETYTQWCNGDVYTFEIYAEDGELYDGYGNVYSLDEIKSGAGKEWADEDMLDYLNP